MKDYLTLDNVNIEGKIVCVRLDINSPILNKKIVLSQRILESCDFINELISKGAKIVLIAHQGRKKSNDFVSLKNHTELMERELKTKIKFYKDIYNERIEKAILNLKSKKIILLENLRFFEDEENFENIELENNKINKLVKLSDYYILDCFSVCHRNNFSISQIKNKEIICGRNLEKELKHLEKLENIKSHHIAILGGNKPDDLLEFIEISLEENKVNKFLLCGVIGELGVIAKGNRLGKKEKNLIQLYFSEIEKLKYLIEKYPTKIIIPLDLAIYNGEERIEIDIKKLNLTKNKKLLEKYLTNDIGNKTINFYEKIISNSKSIYIKGPIGNFEIKHFEKGSKEIFKCVANNKKAFSFIGGGHTTTAAKMFNLLDKFDYVSLAGGALVKYLEGKKLIGIEVLKKSFKEYKNKLYDFIICGSLTIDIKVNVPFKLNQLELGSKINCEEGIKFGVGGGGFNVGVCLSKFESKIGLLCKTTNEFNDLVLDNIQKNKLDLIKVEKSKKSIAKGILLQTKDKDRIIFGSKGQNTDLKLEDFNFKDLKSNNFLFSTLSKTSFLTQKSLILKIKKKNKNSKIGLILSGALFSEKIKISRLIKNIDVLICNFEEAKFLTDKRDIDECLKGIKNLGAKIVIITDGVSGSYGFNGKDKFFQKSIKQERVIDTTGAGDCFAGTFFYFFSKYYSIEKSLEYASINSSNFIGKNGTQKGLLTFNELTKKNYHIREDI
jgi:phosphoglycerate kinase